MPRQFRILSQRCRRVRRRRLIAEQLEPRSLLATFVVNSTGDEPDDNLGDGIAHTASNVTSLRAAIEEANAFDDGGPDTINFSISGAGVKTIAPSTALPTITAPVIIDGYTQPGSTPNTNAIDDPDPAKRGLNGTLLIQLLGPAGGTPALVGLTITGSGSTVRGLVINGFANSGIAINGGDNNVIVGDYIGVDPTGLSAAGNGKWGILVNAGAAGNRIGTDGDGIADEAERNLIGGSGFGGVGITGTGADNNVVAGNFIGLNSAGTAAISNANRGVDVFNGAQHNRIGTNADGNHDGAERNVISGNGWAGVGIDNAGTSFNVVAGNWIGIDVTGATALPNAKGGVDIFSGATSNTIGGLAAAAGNVIAFNALHGVSIVTAGTTDNPILGNSIFRNDGLGIDLGPTGTTVNDLTPTPDADSGPNNLQNFPALVAAQVLDDGRLSITYNVPSDPANSTFPLHVQFFKADADGQEGQTFLGDDIYDATDAGTSSSIVISPPIALQAGDKIVATATDHDGTGNTSEFSAPLVVRGPGCTLVTNTSDSGIGSLRNAIICANNTTGFDTITFDIPANDPGHVYYKNDHVPGQVSRDTVTQTTASTDAGLADPDPDWPYSWWSIQEATYGAQIQDSLTIDGYTQPGAKPNSSGPLAPSNAVLRIEFTGSPLVQGLTGFTAWNSGATSIRGLAINGFSFVGISVVEGTHSRIEGNYIGTDISGTLAIPNQIGVKLWQGASQTIIGGSDPAAGNLISGNLTEGLAAGGYDEECGGGNHEDGPASGTIIRGNKIGTDASGSRPLGNGASGVVVGFNDSSTAAIGGSGAGDGNIIAFNGVNGINLVGSQTAILGNSIFSNTNLGISFDSQCTALANDAGDADTGVNNLQNSPAISYATRDGGKLKVTYQVDSLPANSTYPMRVEFFLADANGQGQTYLGFDTLTDYTPGGKTVTLTTAAPIYVFNKIVATATDSFAAAAGGGPANTSEFSPSVTIVSPWQNPGPLRWDVNDDKSVSADDVLDAINYINAKGSGALPDDAVNQKPYYDVDGDDSVVAGDVIYVINYINAGRPFGGEAEATQASVDGDNVVIAMDDIDIINYINSGRPLGGEAPPEEQAPSPELAEPGAADGGQGRTGDVMAILAADVAAQTARKRRG